MIYQHAEPESPQETAVAQLTVQLAKPADTVTDNALDRFEEVCPMIRWRKTRPVNLREGYRDFFPYISHRYERVWTGPQRKQPLHFVSVVHYLPHKDSEIASHRVVWLVSHMAVRIRASMLGACLWLIFRKSGNLLK